MGPNNGATRKLMVNIRLSEEALNRETYPKPQAGRLRQLGVLYPGNVQYLSFNPDYS